MNFYKLLHLVFGEYVFFLESRDFPRFSSLLLKNNISFWGVEHGEEGVFLHSSLFSAESACTLAEQNGVRLTLCKKCFCLSCLRDTEKGSACFSGLCFLCFRCLLRSFSYGI
ncbi:MAG: hypothetical protein IKM32_05925 [Clostridia bacterium]|nr:hypothetical protein [Clostridia bacterium]